MTPWSQLTVAEKTEVHKQMVLAGASSVNGVSGWYISGCYHRHLRRRPLITTPVDCVSVPDTAPEPLALEELRDIVSAVR